MYVELCWVSGDAWHTRLYIMYIDLGARYEYGQKLSQVLYTTILYSCSLNRVIIACLQAHPTLEHEKFNPYDFKVGPPSEASAQH